MFCLKKTLFALVLTCALIMGIARADFYVGPATNLGAIVNSSSGDFQPYVSPDGLSLYFASTRPGGSGREDIWVTTRATTGDAWTPPTNLGSSVNNQYWEKEPCVSADGLTLYFESSRPNGTNNFPHIYFSTRPTIDDPWGWAQNLGQVNRECAGPCISADGLSLCMASNRAGGIGPVDLYVATRPSPSDDWGPWTTTENLGKPINSTSVDRSPHVSPDGRVLFFNSNRPGGIGGHDLWMTTRAAEGNPWRNPVNLGPEINTIYDDAAPCISSDGFVLYFNSNRPGGSGHDIWQAPILPVVDFNGDDKVDGKDVLSMTDSWGTDDSLCDIGPMPWGDGVVDVEDLKVLAGYIGEPVDDPTLVAHWALDEAGGIIAYDSAGECNGIVMGRCTWRPAGGQVGGALELDGTTYIVLDPVLNPAEGLFSVFAWVQGGAPGQVLIAQVEGCNWLGIDSVQGTLTTELAQPTARMPIPPLISDVLIADGNWHRVGMVWNGMTRALYVDDALVAEDVQPSLASCSGGLNIGCDTDQTAGTFFTGLIDDVRIYNRTIQP
jgi:hypothetical protein